MVRAYSRDEEKRDALWTRIRTLAQCLGPGGARYETPSLLVMALGGKELSTLWETYISKYDAPGTALLADRKPVGSGAGQHVSLRKRFCMQKLITGCTILFGSQGFR